MSGQERWRRVGVSGSLCHGLPDEKIGMQRPGEIEDVKKKIHARARKVL